MLTITPLAVVVIVVVEVGVAIVVVVVVVVGIIAVTAGGVSVFTSTIVGSQGFGFILAT